nr:rod shape-determining protein MreD [Mesobacillus harenae]
MPILFAFLFIAESLFVQLFPADLFNNGSIFVPHFLWAAIFFLAIYGSTKSGILYGFVFGLLFDIVYTEIIGIYMFMFPVLTYLFSRVMKALQTNIVIVSLVSLLGIAVLEIGVYEILYLIHRTNMEFSAFATLRLYPTLLLNLVFIIIAAYPLRRRFERYADELRND